MFWLTILSNNPNSKLFSGKGLILGGSHSPNYNLSNSLVGDLSAILIENINPLANLVRVPSKEVALLSDFEVKRDRMAKEVISQNVTNIFGCSIVDVVSFVTCNGTVWKETFCKKFWPNLEVFFPWRYIFYTLREQYEQLISKQDMQYMETYNASEGFFWNTRRSKR